MGIGRAVTTVLTYPLEPDMDVPTTATMYSCPGSTVMVA